MEQKITLKKARYKHGEKIGTLEEFADLIEKRSPVYFRHKFMAAGFIEHWSFIQIRTAIKFGNLDRAILTCETPRISCGHNIKSID